MKIGEKIKFYLFGMLTEGVIYNIDKKEKTVDLTCDGYNYPGVRTLERVPRKKKDVPPWYILK